MDVIFRIIFTRRRKALTKMSLNIFTLAHIFTNDGTNGEWRESRREVKRAWKYCIKKIKRPYCGVRVLLNQDIFMECVKEVGKIFLFFVSLINHFSLFLDNIDDDKADDIDAAIFNSTLNARQTLFWLVGSVSAFKFEFVAFNNFLKSVVACQV